MQLLQMFESVDWQLLVGSLATLGAAGILRSIYRRPKLTLAEIERKARLRALRAANTCPARLAPDVRCIAYGEPLQNVRTQSWLVSHGHARYS